MLLTVDPIPVLLLGAGGLIFLAQRMWKALRESRGP